MPLRRFAMVALLGSLAACALALPSTAQKQPSLTWVFLNQGSNKAPLDKEEARRLQAAHIGNLEHLGKQGKALTAGPLGDNGTIRGIVVLKVQNRDNIPGCFQDDPFVQKGYLAVEAYPWLTDAKLFHAPNTPFKMGHYTLGLVRQGSQGSLLRGRPNAETLHTLIPSLRELSRTYDLAVSGPVQCAKDLLGVLIFRVSDQSRIKAVLGRDASVQAGRVRVELHPLWLAEGVL